MYRRLQRSSPCMRGEGSPVGSRVWVRVGIGVWAMLLTACGCGTIFEADDEDKDGYDRADVGGDDCDDSTAAIHPGANEVPYNGIDEDCTGADLTDVDGDGEASTKVSGGRDCKDQDANVYASSPERCDGVDNNCTTSDTVDDGDGDGDPCPAFGLGRDCNDADDTIWFGAPEVPYDGIDQDCVGGDIIDYDNDGEPALGAGGIDCNDHLGIREPFEQVELVIPAGSLLMGAPESDPYADESETPMHEVELSPYCIDPFEVSNVQYRACVDARVCVAPQGSLSNTGRANYFRDPQFDSYPVVGVTWQDAMTYCAQDDRTLPTEAQWERAARGGCELGGSASECEPESDFRTYPWGEALPTCTEANFSKNGGESGCLSDSTADTDRVESRLEGLSPYGLYNMAGNVAEWIFDFYSSSAYEDFVATPVSDPSGPTQGEKKVVRGGSYSDTSPLLRTSARSASVSTTVSPDLGFRCARSHLPAVELANIP